MKKIWTLLIAAWMAMPALAAGWPANYAGVMLQGFYWDSYDDTKWATLESNADELGDLFDLIWIPNSGSCDASGTSRQMGYAPVYWLRHNSCFGNETQLRSMIETYRAKGTGILMDLVLNHKSGVKDWCDFANETVTGKNTGKTYQVTWDNEKYSQICNTDECNASGYKTTGAADEGENFDGSRDLDHTNATTQANVITYMDFLLNELGFSGFRLDMTKGYAGYYTGIYNNATHPTFSVGEYWDGNADVLRGWLNDTHQWRDDINEVQSATFDFALKYRINEACSGTWSALNDKGLCADPTYNRYAVTFVDNHDTSRDDWNKCGSNIAAANAIILVLPGTPCVFLQHYKTYKREISNMIRGRRAAGIHNQSEITVQQESNGGYIIETQGKFGKAYLQVGNAVNNGTPSGFQLVQSGTAYKYYVSEGLDWRNSTKQGGNIGGGGTIDPTPDPSKLTIYVQPSDPSGSYFYAWDDSEKQLMGAWPGTMIGSLGRTEVAGSVWYYKTFDVSKVNIIFNNGNGGDGNQTEDIKGLTSSAFFTYSGGGNYKNVTNEVAGYIDYQIPDIAPRMEGHVYAYLETNDYATPSVYTWNALKGNKEYSGSWPGTKMTSVGTAPNGKKVWLWDGGTDQSDMPDHIIFNDSKTSNAAQTADLTFVNGGYYTLMGTVGCLEPTDKPEPTHDTVYIMGSVNGNGWAPNVGYEMATEDGIVHTAGVTITDAVGYFSFSTKLAETAGEAAWDDIAMYRFGALSDDPEAENRPILASELGTALPLSADGYALAFGLGRGTYEFTIDLKARTLTVTGSGTPIPEPTGDVYILGEVNGNTWAPNVGYQMTKGDNNIYTATIECKGENSGVSYFSFTKVLAETAEDWDGIGAYRFGAVSEDPEAENFPVTEEMLGTPIAVSADGSALAFGIAAGTYDLSLDLVARTLTIVSNGTPIPQPETDVYIMGEVNGNGWAPNVGYKMTAKGDNVFEADVTTTGNGSGTSYFSFTTKLAGTATDWDGITPYRFGAVSDDPEAENRPILATELGSTLTLSGDGSALAFGIADGSYHFVVNRAARTLVVTAGSGADPMDINNDGKVDVGDVNAVLAAILAGDKDTALDVNHDGSVDVGDVNAILDAILSK